MFNFNCFSISVYKYVCGRQRLIFLRKCCLFSYKCLKNQLKHAHFRIHPFLNVCLTFPTPFFLYKFQDVDSLQGQPEMVQGFSVYDVVWLHGAGASPESTSPCLHLNATLYWDYPTELVRHFRVYWRQLRGPDPRIPTGQLVKVGQAYSNMFRVTELAVLEPPGLLQLLVEPVTRKGLPVPESQWGRQSLSYTKEITQTFST